MVTSRFVFAENETFCKTSIYAHQEKVSIQPRTSPPKFVTKALNPYCKIHYLDFLFPAESAMNMNINTQININE